MDAIHLHMLIVFVFPSICPKLEMKKVRIDYFNSWNKELLGQLFDS